MVLEAEYWRTPPVNEIVPDEPMAADEPSASVPPESVVPAGKLLVPPSVVRPLPDCVKPPGA